jgi:hypothetical protein
MTASRLVRVAEFADDRPTRCRHCDEMIRYGEPVLVDPDNPWLTLREACLQGLGADPLVRIYDNLAGLDETDFAGRSQVRTELERLETDIQSLRLMFDERQNELPGMFRPGVRRVLPPARETRLRRW